MSASQSQSNETQIALLAQKFDFLTSAVERLDDTMQKWMQRSDNRHSELEKTTESKIHKTVDTAVQLAVQKAVNELPAIVEKEVKEQLAAVPARPDESGTVQTILKSQWFGYSMITLIVLFGKELIPHIVGLWKGN